VDLGSRTKNKKEENFVLATTELEAAAKIGAAQEKLARAREKYAKADEEFNGPKRRFYAAQQELWSAQAEVQDLRSTKTDGGRKRIT
jgi:hypothetical protein